MISHTCDVFVNGYIQRCGKEAHYHDLPVYIGAYNGYEAVEGRKYAMVVNPEKATMFTITLGDMCEEHYIEFCRRNLK